MNRPAAGVHRVLFLCLLGACSAAAPAAHGQINAYNPYADSQRNLPPVAPDGTLRWGTFYKSAAIQEAYERLWELGACRNTNKAITIPVEMNKVAIDALPEEEFHGTVVGAAGTIHGGMIAFTAGGDGATEGSTLVAALHPAGVSRLIVSGPLPAAALEPGMTVRLRTRVDRRGDVITPAPGFKPAAIEPGRDETVVGTVARYRAGTLTIQLAAGGIRRVTVPVDPAAAVRVDAAQVDLVSPGDVVALKGRVWRGEGRLEDGTVFASAVTVTKPTAVAASPAAAPERLGPR
ncbi:MAG: hypothetical protein EBZ74_07155 [Planctomycetia bacterium]|nr:hypothetical protein [Planctomycetia bacterium]